MTTLARNLRSPRLIVIGLTPVLYYLGARLGVTLTVMPEGIAILWPPNSVLLAALLLLNGRDYFLLGGLALAAEVAADLPAFSLAEALLFGLVNVAEATIAFGLLRRWRFDQRFVTVAEVFKFAAAGPVLASLAAALGGALIYTAFRGGATTYLEFMRIWWFGDALGLMVFTPLWLILWPRTAWPLRPAGGWRPADGLALAGAAAAVGLLLTASDGIVLGMHAGPLILLPFVLYLAARLGGRWTAVSVAAASLLTVALLARGRDPFGPLPPREAVIQAQEFLFILSVMGLGVAALLDQVRGQQRALEAANQRLNELNTALEARVAERTAELTAANTRLEHLALTDPLTGLLNRRAFFEFARGEVARSKRYGHPLALLLLDLDHFKDINDRYGHQMGDQVLAQAAAAAAGVVRVSDRLARYGGEEFVVLAPETNEEGGLALAGRIRAAIRAVAVPVGDERLNITASIGVASLDEASADVDQLLRCADQALYAAKAAGRDRAAAA